jgi:uncharacterized protein YjbJ (UPF0337 family)
VPSALLIKGGQFVPDGFHIRRMVMGDLKKKGAANDAKGKLKEAEGKLTGDKMREAQGKVQQGVGKVQKDLGKKK